MNDKEAERPFKCTPCTLCESRHETRAGQPERKHFRLDVFVSRLTAHSLAAMRYCARLC